MEYKGAGLNKLRFSGESTPWKIEKAGEMFDRKSVRNHPNEEVLSVTQDQGVVLRKDLDLKIDYDKRTTGNYKLVEPGDFIISLRSFQGGIEFSGIQGVVSPAYTVLNGNEHTNNEFYKHYFKSDPLIQKLSKSVEGIRDGKAVSYEMFSKINIPLPSLPEQEKIGGFFSALDEEIEAQSELVDLLALEYTGYSQRIFSQKLRFKDENGNEYPEWEEKKLGEVTDITGGYSFQSKDYATSGSRVIRISDVQSGFISDKDAKFIQEPKENSAILAYQLSSGDIVMSLTGIVGRVAKIEESHTPCYLNQRVAKIIPHEKSNDKFIYSLLNNPSFEKQAMDNATGGAQKNMKTSWLSKFNIPFPSLSEQEKIGGFLSSLSNRLQEEKELLIQLKEQKKAYLQKLLP